MFEDNVSKIKERLDIVEVISGYIKIQKAGMNYRSRCPFHNEKTPSFYISPERQIWHCFGCQKGGDIFRFVQEIEGVEFYEALKILAQKAGIELQSFDPKLKNEKDVLYEINENAARFFEKQFFSTAGRPALKYLVDRGLSAETIKDFRLGFAPDNWDALTNFLQERGYKEKDIATAGLAIKRETGSGIYDRFRSRIVFPIFDLNDRVVGFTGRMFEETSVPPSLKSSGEASGAKYINSPQTLIYDKSMVLYGLSKAKANIRLADKCVLVEGNMDALMSYQAGTMNVVATSGTALTQNHLKLLQRYTTNLDFCFDTDQAGAIATRRGIGMALSHNFNVKAIEIKDAECKDPADYVKKYGPGWNQVVADSKPVIEFYFDKLKGQVNPSQVEGKKTVIAVIAPFIRRLASKIERAHWITQLAFFLKTKEEAVEADINSAKDDLAMYEYSVSAPVATPAAKEESKEFETDILSEALLSVAIKNPSLFKEDIKNIPAEFLDEKTAEVILRLASEDLQVFNFDNFVKKFEGDKAMKLEFAYLRAQELWDGFKDEELSAEFYNLVRKIKLRALNAQLVKLEYDIKEAENAGDREKINRSVLEFTRISRDVTENQKN